MAKADYYQTLGVAKNASPDELKKAYRGLAMQYHPDRNPGDATAEQKFKDVSEAYDVLRDEQKRAAYDRFGHDAFTQGGGGRGGFDFSGFGTGFADIFDEVFGDLMGGGRGGGRQNARGSDVRYDLELSLEEAFAGIKKQIKVTSSLVCDGCKGSGGKAGTAPVACPACGGRGVVRAQSGFFMVERACASCQGTGKVIKEPCETCHGHGRMRQQRTLEVAIPAGVEDGTRIRLAGEGEAGLRGAPAGDLYVFLSVKPHPLFQRDGANIFCRVPVGMADAALGLELTVPTVAGSKASVKLPPGTQTGQQFRLRGEGMSVLRSRERGDMYVEAFVETPQKLNKKQQELLRQFMAEGDHGKTNPEASGFMARVEEFWRSLKI